MRGLGFDRIAVVQKLSDGYHSSQRRRTAHVIGIKVRDQQVVDLLQTKLLRRLIDSLSIPVVGGCIACIGQQGLPCLIHNEGGCAALDIHEIDSQAVRLSSAEERT